MNYEEAFHQVGELREHGKFAEALSFLGPLLLTALEEKQYRQVVATGMEKAAIFRHLFLQTGESLYLDFAWSALVEVARWRGENEPAFTFWEAQVLLSQKKYQEAEEKYLSVLEVTPKDAPAAGNYQLHFGVAHFLAGHQAEGLHALETGIDRLKAQQEQIDPYTYHVWLSGAYLRKAQLLAVQGNTAEAQHALSDAAAIIAERSDLVLRQQHLEKTRAFLTQEHPVMETLF